MKKYETDGMTMWVMTDEERKKRGINCTIFDEPPIRTDTYENGKWTTVIHGKTE